MSSRLGRLWLIGVLLLTTYLGIVVMNVLQQPEIERGRLRPCPDRPNCVSSIAARDDQRVDALRFRGSVEEARQRLLEVLRALPRTTLVVDDPTYLHVEIRSLVFRFVDDLEFMIDAEGKRIEVRSASRVGYSDLGVNRRRVDTIRAAFEQSS